MQISETWKPFLKFKLPLVIILSGLATVFLGTVIFKNREMFKSPVVEVVERQDKKETKLITVEIAGEIKYPGVYKLPGTSRVEDLLIISGGFGDNYNKDWCDKYLNRASLLSDGQKVYIPPADYHSGESSARNGDYIKTVQPSSPVTRPVLVNINTAGLSELESLPGIGLKIGQSIIEQRPYSNSEELLTKKVIGKNLYEKIKDLISVY